MERMNEETKAMGHVQVTLVDSTVKLQETTNTSRSKVRYVSYLSLYNEDLSGPNHSCRVSSCSASLVCKGETLCPPNLTSNPLRVQFGVSDCQQRGI